jgi:TP901 family phage tail tape measure protein
MPGLLGTVSGQIRMDVRQAVAAYAAVRAQNSKLLYALRGSSESFIRSGKAMATAGAGLVYVFGKAVSSAAEFQRRMDFFGAVTNANKKQIADLSAFVLKLGQNSIFSVNEIADGFIELGKAGIGTKDIIDGIGKAMVNLGSSADIPLQEAGQIITSTIKTFALQATDATHVVNELQGAANATIADVSDIGVSLKYVGGIAATTGVSLNDTITAISLLAQAGIRGSTAGTSLRQMLVSLGGATAPAAKELQTLGIITKNGSNLFYTQAGNIKPLAQVYQILQNHTKKLNNEQRLAALRTIFNNRALAAASILSRAGAKGFAQMNKEIGKTTAAEVAHKRLNNLSGDLKKLKANIDILFIKGGSPFQKNMRGWVKDITRLVKAFSNMDPHTQKMIFQTIGMSGAILLAMGILNIFIGTILKFIANMIQMGIAVKFVLRWIGILITNLRWAIALFGPQLAEAIGISVGALFFWVAVIVAVIAAVVILYKKWTPFRNLVNTIAKAIWSAIKAFVKFVAAIVRGAPQAWNSLVKGVKGAWNSVKNFFTGLYTSIKNFFSRVGHDISSFVGNVRDFVSNVVNWFKQLPSRIGGILSRLVATVKKALTFRNVGFAIGFFIGFAIRLFFKLWTAITHGAAKAVIAAVKWFVQLDHRVTRALLSLAIRAAVAMARLAVRLAKGAAHAVTAVINWFKRLPGRVAAFLVQTAARAITAFNRARVALPRMAGQAYTAITNWFSKLPGRVSSFFQRMASRAIQFLQKMASSAQKFGDGIYNGIVTGIQGLPAAVGDILGKVISAIKGVITQGFNAVKQFAAGLWAGFKKGIGMNSPSFIERAMWQITGVMEGETKRMAKHTLKVQALSKQLAMTGWHRGDYTSGRSGVVELASMHARNRNRLRSVAGSAGKRRVRIDAGQARRPKGDRHAKMTITNWRDGTGYMREIAEDAIDDEQSFVTTVSEMDY